MKLPAPVRRYTRLATARRVYERERAARLFGVLRLLDPADGAPATLGGALVYPLDTVVTSIGRGLHNGVVLLSPAVSREHARLLYTPASASWLVENASAHNDLTTPRGPVMPGGSAHLAPGECFTLGGVSFQLLAPDATDNAQDAPSGEEAHAATSMLTSSIGRDLRMLAPGVTLQVAWRRLRRSPRWRAKTLLALAFVCICAALTLGVAALLTHTALTIGGFTQALIALLIPIIPALGVSLLVYRIDRYEREPLPLLLGAFLWGALIAIPPALFIERLLDGALAALLGPSSGATVLASLTPSVLVALTQGTAAAIIEELIKGAGLVALLVVLRDEFDNVTDGVLYGLLIGAGFAIVENFAYFALGSRADLPFLVFGRIILGWLSHSTFTALIGAGLGFARERHRRRSVAPFLGLLAAIALHAYFDGVTFTAPLILRASGGASTSVGLALVALALAYGPLFGAQAYLLRLTIHALRREAAIIREYLAADVLAGVVTPEEYLVVQRARLRSRAERRALFDGGPRAYMTARALYQTAIGLAFRRWHVAMGDPAKPTALQPEDLYRKRLLHLRRALDQRVERVFR